MKLPLAIIFGLSLTFATASTRAGGGPENVLLLVNANSESSKTIANYYIQWRRIPASNVVYLDWKGSRESTSAESFRERILLPALLAMDQRHLASQIDYIIYSSDFPWRIDMRHMFASVKPLPNLSFIASLTGATYLAPFVLSENSAIVFPDTNWYVPGPTDANLVQCEQLTHVPSRALRGRYLWDESGKRTKGIAPGRQYRLSTMLGVTSGRGNTVDEVLNYLRRSIKADGSHPRGTIYFMWNKDVRSTPRDKCFPSIAAQINAAGVRAVVQQGRLPHDAKDVAGLMIGTSSFDLSKEGIQIVPGAICDNLTSDGGDLSARAGQTPLTEFLRHGAAGASGTVVEPYNIQAKFPLASIQLHYVRGCSLAEAVYQSVSGPYQLLIVGDPLCQPWASIPTIFVAGVKPWSKVKGSLTLRPSGTNSVGVFELFVDGRLTEIATAGKPLALDTTKLLDGYHELRVVGYRSDPIETQGRSIVPIIVANHPATIELKLTSASRVELVGKLKLSVRQRGAKAIVIRQNSREVVRVQGESGEKEISAATLGRGPTVLQAFSEGPAGAASAPVNVDIE
ncbi:MAG TPA: hypothetical protein VHE81_02180 [Lacipirellulaceae bacterium]|nr:hypothetical protein [Lacipirellulaceae bacterium]